MKSCKYIKKRIDEAEKPDLLPFDVSEHIGQCGDCESFATERSALRQLVAAGTRVSAPINFDAVLKARLAEVKARRSFWWLGSPGFLRLGAATAGVVVTLFAAQYAGFFVDTGTQPEDSDVAVRAPIQGPKALPAIPDQARPSLPPAEDTGIVPLYQGSFKAQKAKRGGASADRAVPSGYITAEDGGVVLVRGRDGDLDVQMPTVSVGAQPLLYVSAGQRTARSVGTSF